ncbi:hypothetical protein B4064_2535 [Caldibacillus thermoamylovorans]|uniref:Uncharacterized protein n=1 Tax=Caldibacillus thermoamylovorans TaxID=35841 RepID=A0A0D0GDT6_9BACI|nr:hypothetical protein B4064_2535 [Caldibacillus thermoamylovorans]KIO66066.1 hypothetical protein B4166_1079 [Caldibacillus thermoamylovorans]KIO66729.1 hypothetical protein B4065_2273 [Caldibacillus thermoamylovorans]KIO72491.1 hypothetical protein B4167_1181 [Caldibacillus thermoamylovorans]
MLNVLLIFASIIKYKNRNLLYDKKNSSANLATYKSIG